jgi:hypothetical protein
MSELTCANRDLERVGQVDRLLVGREHNDYEQGEHTWPPARPWRGVSRATSA